VLCGLGVSSLLALVVLFAGCSGDDDDNPAQSGTADDDDDNDDDNDNDNDSLPDDDDNDDNDATDDDDDNDDNDNDDNDDDDDYAECDTFPATDENGFSTEVVAGAAFSESSAAVDSGGTLHVVGHVVGRLYLYHWAPDGGVTGELFSPLGSDPDLTIDAADRLHMVYDDYDLDGLVYAHQTAAGGDWVREVLSQSSRQGGQLAVEPDGSAHIAFVDWEDERVYHTTNRFGDWTREPVGPGGAAYNTVYLAVDGAGDAHIQYEYDVPFVGGWSYYCTNKGGRWTREDLGDSGILGSWGIAADANGDAHLIVPGNGLQYANNVGGQWKMTPIDSSVTPLWASLALDADGRAHVAYEDADAADLLYADNVSGEWTKQTLASAGDVGAANDLALDAAGRPYVSFLNDTRWAIWAAKNVDGAWTSRELARGCGETGRELRLAADSNGALHVLYQPGDWETAESITYLTNASGAWVSETFVAQDADTDYALAFDADGVLHAGYVDRARRMLIYKYRTADGWSSGEDVMSYGLWGAYPSLAIDDGGAVHFGYYRDRAVLHLTNQSGMWSAEIVDEDQYDNVGIETQIAFAPAGAAHLVYMNEHQGQLKHATNASGAWISEVVEEGVGIMNNEWPYLSLKVDAAGVLHLGYFTYYTGYPDFEVHYAVNAGGGWEIEPVNGPTQPGPESAMALDGDVNPYFIYWSSYALYYARKPAGQWERVALPGAFADDDRYGLLIDADGFAEAIWPSNGALWHARFPKDYPDRAAR
jgi:hypothetical protein